MHVTGVKFSFSLVEKVARVLLTNHRAQQSKTKANYFPHKIEDRSNTEKS